MSREQRTVSSEGNVKELTCIVCPQGCLLSVEEKGADDLTVSGNRCPRGVTYAQEEVLNPKRMVSATCIVSITDNAAPALKRLPVRTNIPCPKEQIPALLADIYKTKIILPVQVGDIVIADWKGSGINVVATGRISGN